MQRRRSNRSRGRSGVSEQSRMGEPIGPLDFDQLITRNREYLSKPPPQGGKWSDVLGRAQSEPVSPVGRTTTSDGMDSEEGAQVTKKLAVAAVAAQSKLNKQQKRLHLRQI